MSTEDKVKQLTEICPNLTVETIQTILRKYKNSVEDSIPDLLELNNKALAKEEEERKKRIEEEKERQRMALAAQKEILDKAAPNLGTSQRINTEHSLAASLTLASIHKTYEQSFAFLEQKIQEQQAEIKEMIEEIKQAGRKIEEKDETIAARDSQIQALMAEVEILKKEREAAKSADSLLDIVRGTKANLDSALEKASVEAPSVDFVKLSAFIKKELAISFLKDYQNAKQQIGNDPLLSSVSSVSTKIDKETPVVTSQPTTTTTTNNNMNNYPSHTVWPQNPSQFTFGFHNPNNYPGYTTYHSQQQPPSAPTYH
eukprot:TRINITY_DN3294_c1_g1_i1.p1 TRINITY_DN3294_c1_g1~~TRINITY_DN3294_c1_g1_i1.p1  ORF type:complete len:314 (-),score=74.61 TRINITY_DN3294_c1_g1_i1:117-1058(-)